MEKAPAAVAGLKGPPMRSKSADVKPASPGRSLTTDRGAFQESELAHCHPFYLSSHGFSLFVDVHRFVEAW